MTGLDDCLVSTVRYFGACPVCGRRERGGEITYATPAEVATAEQTHGCCSTESLPPVLLVVAVYEIAPTAATTHPAWWLKNADATRRW